MRPIDGDALIPMMKYATTDSDGFPIRIGFDEIVNVINNQPTIDAVPVVRCKDCKYRYVEFGQIFCKQLDDMFYHYEDHEPIDIFGFCEKGEREE